MSILLNFDLAQYIIIILVSLNAVVLVVITFLIYKQPENTSITTFKLPFSPFLQMTAVFVNVFLITTLSIDTYIRFGIWFGLGLVIYISYGIRKSGEHRESVNQCWWCLPCIERSPLRNQIYVSNTRSENRQSRARLDFKEYFNVNFRLEQKQTKS